MKNSVLKWYMFAFVLLSDFVMFASDPGNGGENGDPEDDGPDENPTPINTKLIFLVILGVAFAMYYFKNNKKQNIEA